MSRSSPSATGVCAFRKKPVVIEAVQWNGYPVVFKAWMDELGSLPFVLGHSDGTLLIQTLEDSKDGQAKHVADRGDWIIRGIKGEFYPCKPDIFAATYEEASKPSETAPKTLSEFAHADEATRERIGAKVADGAIARQNLQGVTPSARATSLFETRVDCWYQPHKDPGAKVKQPQRVIVTLVHEAADSEDAIKRAREWADSNAPGSKGRKLLSIEHRSTGTKKLPIVEYANGK